MLAWIRVMDQTKLLPSILSLCLFFKSKSILGMWKALMSINIYTISAALGLCVWGWRVKLTLNFSLIKEKANLNKLRI